jgi:sRNA-binding carbon storage regulator CsrA
MLILQPKLNEWIVLSDCQAGRQVASMKMFLANGRTRLAFDIPKEIQVTREPLEQGSAKDGKRS